MNKLLFTNLVFIVCLFSQNSKAKTEDSYNWNPLHTGDIWEYVDFYDAHHFRRVVKDTIIDGRTYFKVEQFKDSDPFDWGIVYERTADNATYLYDLYDWDNNPNTTELLSDSFNTPIGSSYISYKYYQEYNMPSEVRILERYPSYLSVYDTTVTIVKIDRLPITGDGTHSFLKTSQADNETWAAGFGLYEYVPETNHFFLLGSIINGKTYGTVSDVNKSAEKLFVTDFYLFPNYPNPFNSNTKISFLLKRAANVQIAIYDINGKMIKRLTNRFYEKGRYFVLWNGTDQKQCRVSTGLYFCVMTTGRTIFKRKLILLY